MNVTQTRARTQALVLSCLRLVRLRFLSSATLASAVLFSVLLVVLPPSRLFLMFFCLPFFLLFAPLLARPFTRLFFIVFLVVLQRPHLQMSRQLVHKLFFYLSMNANSESAAVSKHCFELPASSFLI